MPEAVDPTLIETAVHGRQEHHQPYVPYDPIGARSSTWKKHDQKTSTFRAMSHEQIIPSTLDEFVYALTRQSKGKETTHDPLQALFRIIRDDTETLVDVVRVSLRKIREGTLNEDLMQKCVMSWRTLLHQLNFGLADLDQQIRILQDFVYDHELHHQTGDGRKEPETEKLVRTTNVTLKSCIELIERCSSSLLSEMQIVDSRRSIAEAESISKLTELAFVFVPLSFVASLFSMQIHELSGGVPGHTFALVAILFVLAAYAVRLSIRSARLVDYQTAVSLRLRVDCDLQPNEPIPTHRFIMWGSRTLGKATITLVKKIAFFGTPALLGILLLGAVLSPIILLWFRTIDKGFTAVITTLLLMLDVVLIYPVGLNVKGRLTFSPKQIIQYLGGDRIHAIKKRYKRRARAIAKRKGQLDPEAVIVESVHDSENDSRKKASILSAEWPEY